VEHESVVRHDGAFPKTKQRTVAYGIPSISECDYSASGSDCPSGPKDDLAADRVQRTAEILFLGMGIHRNTPGAVASNGKQGN